MNGDWIKLHRCILDSAVFADDWLTRLWLWCLCKANFRDSTFRGQVVKRGQFVTGRVTGAGELNVSPSKWYRGLQKLEELGNVTLAANSNWTTVTICKFDNYQFVETKSEQRTNSERTADEQPADTIEEDQEFKKYNTQATADRLMGMVVRSEAFNRFMKAYPRPTSPEAAWEVWQAKIFTEVMRQGKTDEQIENMIVAAAEEFRDSPAGRSPDGGQDYRLSAHKWLMGNCWEEPRELWQQPNAKPDAKPRRQRASRKTADEINEFFGAKGLGCDTT